jgi:integrase/recombinase XerD
MPKGGVESFWSLSLGVAARHFRGGVSCLSMGPIDRQETIMDSRSGAQRHRRIIVEGPLARFVEGLRRDLAGQGYALDTVGDHMHLFADLSDWLCGRGLVAADLTTQVAEEFLCERRAAGRRVGVTPRGIAPVLGHLRRVQVAPPHAVTPAATAMEILLADYGRHLVGERGLSAGTVTHYLRCAKRFLRWLPGPPAQSLPALSAGQVTDYVMGWTAAGSGNAVDMVTLPALRSLLRFMHADGHVPRPLAAAVPAGRRRPAHVGMPRAASNDHVRAVLGVRDRASAAGRRDYAILLMMARLAVRGGEVARLNLADVNWRAGEVTIHGKGGRVDILPLPADVGEAMADYLLHARPATASETLFVTLVAPFGPLATSTVTVMVARCCSRAGVPRFGPHGMRHAAACDLLAAGASMQEIGQLLRHAQQRTTAIYAKLDQARLSELARPCPQGAPR